MGGAAVAATEMLAGKVPDCAYTPCGDHGFRDHGTTRMPYVDAHAGHERVDLLGHL